MHRNEKEGLVGVKRKGNLEANCVEHEQGEEGRLWKGKAKKKKPTQKKKKKRDAKENEQGTDRLT